MSSTGRGYKWTEDRIKSKAEEFKTLAEFNKQARSAAIAAKRLGVFEEVTSHLHRCTDTWTEEALLKALKNIPTFAILNRDYRKLSKAAKKLGIFEEGTAHMLQSHPKKFRELYAKSGIYFLYDGFNIVYIGKSTKDMYGRVVKHYADTSKVFNKVVAYEIENTADLAVAEVFLINKHKPLLNKDSKSAYALTLDVTNLNSIITKEITIEL